MAILGAGQRQYKLITAKQGLVRILVVIDRYSLVSCSRAITAV